MQEKKKSILEQWLQIDFCNIENKIGFADMKIEVSDNLILDSIRCLDYETTMTTNPSVNYVITIIALMWEYADHQKFELRKIVVKFLSRIGYPTSAIIADKDFDKNNCIFSSLDSPIEQLLATLNQAKNSIEVNGHKFLLTKFQMEIWNAMDSEKLIGISAPTSAGKSFVILLKLIEKLINDDFDIVYIVPTLSLLNQVSEDFNKTLKQLNISNCRVSNTFVENIDDECRHIFVLTQEKAIASFSDERNTFTRDIILVADEIQNIERIKEDDDERAKVLFDTLNEYRYKDNVKQIIISGPRIEDIEKTGKSIFGIDAKDITSIDSPVLNLTYSISKSADKYYLKQYCGLTDFPLIKEIVNSEIIKGYGKQRYDEQYLAYLNILVNSLSGQQNIIFSPTAPTARRIACSINTTAEDNPKLSELIDYYKDTVHPSYAMCDTLRKSMAYHHGKLPDHVRRTIEKAIHNKWINNIACTTTLLQGVNLPTQNIIVRNPHLYLQKRKESAELSNYEMANLRGRAGRLLKDFIGRTFVLDESSFASTEGYQQETLFDEETKELPGGYGEKYEKYKDSINEIVLTDTPISNEMYGYGDMVTYVRQSVLRYGSQATQKMNNVGVTLTKEQVAAIILKLEQLSVPKDICYKNRYWDPFVLDTIYLQWDESVPNYPIERGAKAKLDRMLKFLRDNPETSAMYSRNIPPTLRQKSGRSHLVNLCMLWAKETSLYDILEKGRYNDESISDEIEDTIEILQNTVSYRVPLLLKPIFDIKNPNSVFLSCMQSGAYNKVTKQLIEMGVPRECALYLKNVIFKDYKSDEKDDITIEKEARNLLETEMDKLPYWIRVQLEFLG